MSCCRISKQEVASPGGIAKVGLSSFGKGRVVARWLVAWTVASVLKAAVAAVIQMTRMPRYFISPTPENVTSANELARDSSLNLGNMRQKLFAITTGYKKYWDE
ncbi:hypothetical protein AVEN_80097-1 [Araneus ventricosus]|uniref:Uncharacterized protein n=1 Tax=Araneus ventricosus TaxID=182803 RepID=A0A4Y2THX4_ARAVE|nr:hypothetical protein AVEN_80097-1 [Araneus ventricosus]